MIVIRLIEGLSWANIVGFWVGSHRSDLLVIVNIAIERPKSSWKREKCSQLVPSHFGKKAIQR